MVSTTCGRVNDLFPHAVFGTTAAGRGRRTRHADLLGFAGGVDPEVGAPTIHAWWIRVIVIILLDDGVSTVSGCPYTLHNLVVAVDLSITIRVKQRFSGDPAIRS